MLKSVSFLVSSSVPYEGKDPKDGAAKDGSNKFSNMFAVLIR